MVEKNDIRLDFQIRSELRKNYLVPIHFMHTSNVPQKEARISLLGALDVLAASGQNRDLLDLGSLPLKNNGDFSSPDWYVNAAIRQQKFRRNNGYGVQIDAWELDKLLFSEPLQQKPHWEIFVINNDLTAPDGKGGYEPFVFGTTDTAFPASMQSITRFMEGVNDVNLRDAMIRRLARHEVGHMFGLPRLDRKNTEEIGGNHCTNLCTMRQGISLQDWAKKTIEEARNRIIFCDDCKNDLAIFRSGYKPLPPIH